MSISRFGRRHRWWRVGLIVAAILGIATAGVVVASAAAPPVEGTVRAAGSSTAIPDSYIVVFNLYNNAGSTDMVVDVVGTFFDPDATASAATAAKGPTVALSNSGDPLWRLTSAQTAARLR
jgi:hypothetical protein